jgi:hypothetical protein
MLISVLKFTFSCICVLNFYPHKTTLTVPVLSTRQYLHTKTWNETEESFTESAIVFTFLSAGPLKPHLSRIILTMCSFLKNKSNPCSHIALSCKQFLLMYVCLISQTLPSHCGKMQVYDEESCECKCVNESEIEACEHPKEWDPNLCSCVCPQSLFCSTGAHIHPDSCK